MLSFKHFNRVPLNVMGCQWDNRVRLEEVSEVDVHFEANKAMEYRIAFDSSGTCSDVKEENGFLPQTNTACFSARVRQSNFSQ